MRSNRQIAACIRKYAVPFLFPVVFFLLLLLLLPDKISLANLPYILTQSVTPAVVAWGACFSMEIGNQNFSTGACIITAAIVGGNLALMTETGVWGLILFCPLVGVLCGCFTGGLFVLLKIPSLIVSIGSLLILESICSVIFDGGGVYLPTEYVVFGNSASTLLFGAVVFLLAYALYTLLPFGYHVRSIGRNPAIARTVGLNVYRTRFLCFVVGGLFCGLYAVLALGSTSVQRPVSAMGSMKFVFDAMMCVFVGTSLGGSMNKIISIFLGSIVMQMLQLTLTAINFSSMFTQAIVAMAVFLAMCYSSRKELVEAARRHKQELEDAGFSRAG